MNCELLDESENKQLIMILIITLGKPEMTKKVIQIVSETFLRGSEVQTVLTIKQLHMWTTLGLEKILTGIQGFIRKPKV